MIYKILVKTICSGNSGQVAVNVVQNVVEFETRDKAIQACEKINGSENNGTSHYIRDDGQSHRIIAYSTTYAIAMF